MSAVLSVAAVRQRFDRALSDAGYTRSRFVPELFAYDADKLVHKSYSVGVGATELRTYDGRADLPVPDEGEAVTAIVLRTAYRLRGDNQLGDYDDALVHEQALLRAALDLDATYLHAAPLGIAHQVTETGEWFISAITVRVWHRYAFVEGV